MSEKLDRSSFDSAITNMSASAMYQKNALFYFHLLTKMKIILDVNLPAPAGVCFRYTHYELYINPKMFEKYSLDDRIFILVHECMHILMGHLSDQGRLTGKNIDNEKANLAEDCAINQLINMTVPKSAIMPNNLLKNKSIKVKPKQNAEYYYKLLLENEPNPDFTQPKNEDGEPNESGDGDGKYEPLDTHDTWKNSKGDTELQKDLTSEMIQSSIEETVKAQGNLPQEIEDIMNMFKRKAQIDWKKVLRNMVGKKKVGKRPTIMRKSRRFQNRPDIKGNTKDRKFNLVCLVDISGSMNNKEVLQGLNEVSSICKTFNISMKLVQVDTMVHKVEDFNKYTKMFERNGCGGTHIIDGALYVKKEKIECDGCVVITDGYIESLNEWETARTSKKIPNVPYMFLLTSDKTSLDGNLHKSKEYPLKVE